MELLFSFAIMVIAISASGVMSPGPLFAANVIYGIKEGRLAGLKMAIGHTIVEFPLIILLGVGILSLDTFPEYRIFVTVIGAIGLFCFAGLQIKSIFKKDFQIFILLTIHLIEGYGSIYELLSYLLQGSECLLQNRQEQFQI